MRRAPRILTASLFAASGFFLSSRVHGQAIAVAAAQAPVTRNARSARDSLYSSAESDFVVGRTVYLRSSKMRIGTILKTDPRHGFPRTFPRPHMKAVLIRHSDGPVSWVPVERITRIYVVNK